MKLYLGNTLTAFAGLLIPLMILVCILFGFFSILSKFCVATLFIFIMCMVGGVFLTYYLLRISTQLYSFGLFLEDKIVVSTLFRKKFIIEYSECADIGIAYYIHGILNSNVGSKICWIYFSRHKLEKKYKSNINLLHPSKDLIKLRCNLKVFQRLITVLPPPYAKMLKTQIQDFPVHK